MFNMPTLTETNRGVEPTTPSQQPGPHTRRETLPSKHESISSDTQSHHLLPFSPLSPTSTAFAYGYYHLGTPADIATQSPGINSALTTAHTPSVDPSVVAVQGSVVTSDNKGQMFKDLAAGKRATLEPKRQGTVEHGWKNDKGDMAQEIDEDVVAPALPARGSILIDYDALVQVPGATTNLCATLFAWKGFGYSIHIWTKDKEATSFLLEDDQVVSVTQSKSVVDRVWELPTRGGQESPPVDPLQQIVADSTAILILNTTSAFDRVSQTLTQGVNVLLLKDLSPMGEEISRSIHPDQAAVVAGWKECTEWLLNSNGGGQ
ncbi:hypothetical protein BD324DRAFT_651169 [Kockovaella imperatae]|uniref:Uncharacterized protein n=1 Tax=Kockovaella imperatae TaxID=4999 RepID=A0A1Y1UF61_9TREE|nr:hypothetical protein BD324DRAFT_651169 [Kockovaella imperatae]ORX36683.1 hypothetical protein BD324DRAFT_651169 [Kockovaella imperatae]